MEKVLIPAALVGGFVVGKNWNKIAKFSGPYLKKGIKNTQKITAKGLTIFQRNAPKVVNGASAFIGKVPTLFKKHHSKTSTRRRKLKIAHAVA